MENHLAAKSARSYAFFTALLALTFVFITQPTSVFAAEFGDLYQPDPYCINDSSTTRASSCSNKTGLALESLTDITFSRDGKNVYTSSDLADAVSFFTTNASSHSLSQELSSPEKGCIADIYATGSCTNKVAVGLINPTIVEVSSDDQHVYVVGSYGEGVATLIRDKNSGTLSQSSNVDSACIAYVYSSGTCSNRTSETISNITDIALSPDGEHLYVAATKSDAITIFDRDANTGKLSLNTSQPCFAESSSTDCDDHTAIGMLNPSGLTISPDGKNLYVAAEGSDALVTLSRDLETGELSQSSEPTKACIAHKASTKSSCTNLTGQALNGVVDAVVSNDGKDLYAASKDSNAISAFSRDVSTGQLTQKTALAACISDTDSASFGTGVCPHNTGLGLDQPSVLALSPDDQALYALSIGSDALASFSRDLKTGRITQRSGNGSCITDITSSSGSCNNNTGLGLDHLNSLAISPDSQSVLTTAENSVGLFAVAKPVINVTTSSITFPNLEVGKSSTQTVTVNNTGTSDLTLSTSTLSGDTTNFSIADDGCYGAVVKPSETCSITVNFAPQSAASFSGSLQLTSNETAEISTVKLFGSATNPALKTVVNSIPTETVQTTTPTPASQQTLSLSRSVAKVGRKGFAKLKLICKGTAGTTCRGTVTLKLRNKRIGKTVKFAVAANTTKTVKYRLTKRYFKKLKTKRRFTVKSIITPTDNTVVSKSPKIKLRR